MAFRKLKAESRERSFQQYERQTERAPRDLKIETCVVAGNVLSSLEETLRQGAALGYENMPLRDASFPLRFPLKTLSGRTFDVTKFVSGRI
jgi:hypothetical protein